MQRLRTSGKGNVSEAKVLGAYLQAGFFVSVPFGTGAPYDLIVDTGERLLKIQVKTGRLRNGCILFAAQRINGHQGSLRQLYEESDLDFFAVYCPDNDQIYVVPRLGNLAEGRLRIEKTGNNQRDKVRWAEEFTFDVHVQQMKVRMELVGLEPTTSAMPLQRSSKLSYSPN